MPDVRVLRFHAAYQCQHAGACCSSDWPIAIEADVLDPIERALREGTLAAARPVRRAIVLVRAGRRRSDPPALLGRVAGRCAFHGDDHRCAIQGTLGHAALPLACRQFPRVTVQDPRGASVTLSHYCPTARGMLGYDGYDRYDGYDGYGDIVVNPARFPPGGEYVGLDARDALPPLLRSDVLMDWESWWRIEEFAVATLLHRGTDVDEAIALIRDVVVRLQAWRPGSAPLTDEVCRAFDDASADRDAPTSALLVRATLDRVPECYRSRAMWTAPVTTADAEARRFTAAHAFANWAVHRKNGGLSAWLTSVETARAFLAEGAGIRHADFILRHLT